MPLSISIRLNTLLLVLLVLMAGAIIAMLAMRAEGGPLDPLLPVGSSMKTLQEVEPRTPISSVPYNISATGSYYLTQNVTMAGAGNGITISADNVVLDLNGYTIDGADIASKGIVVFPSASGVTVRNGTVTRFLSYGFDAQTGVLLENVHANDNQVGIVVRGTLRGCSANDNTLSGVQALYSTVVDCFAQGNAAGFTLEASALSRCSALSNTTGVYLREASSVEGCVVRGGTTGIYVDGASKAQGGNVVRNNTLNYSGGNAINVPGWNSFVEGNTITNAGANQPGSGIAVTGQRNRIEGNHVNDSNGYGIVVDIGSGNVVVRNWADANVTDYFFAPANDAGPIQVPASATSPWANLTH